MKKNFESGSLMSLKKLLLIMKVIFILVFSSILAVSGSTYSQVAKLSLNLKEATIKNVFEAIEKQSEYIFFYQDQNIDLNKQVEIQVNDKDIYEVLDQLFEGTANTYKIKDRQVIIGFDKLKLKIPKKETEIINEEIEQPQKKTITGKVTDEKRESLPGVSVIVKGTTVGITTDVDGNYTLEIPDNAETLVFSYIGMATQVIDISNRTSINVILVSSTVGLDDVVVTALGITRETKSLGYNVSVVSAEELVRAPQENLLNALSGKVTGVVISSTGGTGSSVSMVIRGASSLANDNQPLFVVDGIPINNTLNNGGGFGTNNRVDYGNAISDLNPDDIESMSVLKGASAAALYGSRAGNGVVIITTKSGKKSKGLGVTVNSSTVFDMPYSYFPSHTLFANGKRPEVPVGEYYIDETRAAWMGPELDKGNFAIQWPYSAAELAAGIPVSRPLESHNNNENFYETAITSTNSISVMDQTEKLDYRLSYSNMTHSGMIPNTDLDKNNISTSATFRMNDRLTLTSNLNYTKSGADNRPSTDKGTNPINALDMINSHIDIRDMRDYWLPGQEGLVQHAPWRWVTGDPTTYKYDNPYFLAYEALNSFERNRMFGNIKADYKFNDNLSLMVRYNSDALNEIRETKISKGYTADRNGVYGILNLRSEESNTDFLLSYNKDLDNWDFNGSVGGNIMKRSGSSNTTYSVGRGAGLSVPGVFTIGNIDPSALRAGSGSSKKQINSIYALASFGYKNMVYVDITARNDWSSTLPKENNSYFYPSVSTSLLLNKMVDFGDKVSLIKLRGGWAQVGNDTGPYRLLNTIGNAAAWGSQTQFTQSTSLLTPDLKPEQNTSIEVGTDLAFFQNRLRMEFTYYTSDNKNQIISVDIPNSSGFSRKNINAGLISSKGVEASIGATIVETNDWTWDATVNYSRNRTVIEELVDGLDYIQFWQEGRNVSVGYVGDEIGTIMERRTLVRVDDPNSPYHGWPLINPDGYYNRENDLWKVLDEDGKRTAPVAGNFNPDFQLGLQTSVSYKNFKLAATFDWRSGGQFNSMTMRYANSDAQTQYWIDKAKNLNGIDDLVGYIRENAGQFLLPGGEVFPFVGGPTAELGGFPFDDGGGAALNDGSFLPGVIGAYDANGNFVMEQEQLGGEGTRYVRFQDMYPWNLGAPSLFDADFIKLRDISLTYSIPGATVKKLGLQNMSVSVFSRNIILWTKAGVGIDPENAFRVSGSGFQQGVERGNTNPFVIPVGVKLNVSF